MDQCLVSFGIHTKTDRCQNEMVLRPELSKWIWKFLRTSSKNINFGKLQASPDGCLIETDANMPNV